VVRRKGLEREGDGEVDASNEQVWRGGSSATPREEEGAAEGTCEGPKRRTREGGSEWEPIKILFKNSAYEPKFTRAPPQASLAKFT
jgi:hypothetical protein